MRISVIIRYREPHDKSRQVSFYFEKKKERDIKTDHQMVSVARSEK